MTTPSLRVSKISKSFPGVHALVDVNLEVAKGEIHALLGENGAGKSTLVKTIAGIHTADEGQILFEGQEVKITSAWPSTRP